MSLPTLPGLLLLAAVGAQQPDAAAPPLRVSTAVLPETVTVGGRFRSMVRVSVPAGASLSFPELAVGDSLQPTDSVRLVPGGAGEAPLAVYSLVAWVAGVPLTASVPVRVLDADGQARTYVVPLRLPVVRSVLPADTAGLRPRPARGVVALPVSPRPLWPWVLAGIAALAGLWLLARRWRALRPAPASGSPRAMALDALGRLRDARLAEHRAWDDLYPAVTRVLRDYLAAVEPGLGAELTSAELLAGLAAGSGGIEPATELAPLLQHADRVKFAGYRPEPAEARDFLDGCERWVQRYPPEPPLASAAREAA